MEPLFTTTSDPRDVADWLRFKASDSQLGTYRIRAEPITCVTARMDGTPSDEYLAAVAACLPAHLQDVTYSPDRRWVIARSASSDESRAEAQAIRQAFLRNLVWKDGKPLQVTP